MKALDLYCGLGGWTKGLKEVGFDVVGVDIAKEIILYYPGKLIIQDVRTIDGKRFKGKFDVIVGSPPCRDFSKTTNFGKVKWKNPPNPENGLKLVHAFLRIVEEAQPKIWLMENVVGLCKYLNIKPKVIAYLTPTMRRAFWGNFPPFLIPCVGREKIENITGKLRSWKRAEIPFPVAFSFAQACKEVLK